MLYYLTALELLFQFALRTYHGGKLLQIMPEPRYPAPNSAWYGIIPIVLVIVLAIAAINLTAVVVVCGCLALLGIAVLVRRRFKRPSLPETALPAGDRQ